MPILKIEIYSCQVEYEFKWKMGTTHPWMSFCGLVLLSERKEGNKVLSIISNDTLSVIFWGHADRVLLYISQALPEFTNKNPLEAWKFFIGIFNLLKERKKRGGGCEMGY